MLFLYSLGIRVFNLLLKGLSPFHEKARLFTQGRKYVFRDIQQKIDPNNRPIWFHFASLGEFEQGRPVLEALQKRQADKHFIITFFSPSGYEIRKNYALAPVFYLPLDSKENAEKFMQLVNPLYAVFTKYEFWHFYFQALEERNIPIYLISGIFRPDQIFFKRYGNFNRQMLYKIKHFFVQNSQSVHLLKTIGITQVSLTGDTRFDRVYETASQDNPLPIIADFCGEHKVMVCGSTWPADEALIAEIFSSLPDWKFIIAPHEINESHLQELQERFPRSVRFTHWEEGHQSQILVINNIGMLSRLYQYGDIAYIGGGFGAGIHNTLEAAAFGLPILFGPKYRKFQEAKDLIKIGAAKSVQNLAELQSAFVSLTQNPEAGIAAQHYVAQQQGATAKILNYLTEKHP